MCASRVYCVTLYGMNLQVSSQENSHRRLKRLHGQSQDTGLSPYSTRGVYMKAKVKILRWIPVLIWMGIIFYLSHQDSSDSSALSSGFTQVVLDFLNKNIEHLDMDVLHHLVRKGAHFAAYLILGLLVTHAVEPGTRKASFVTFLICVLYASSDEFHQSFIPGRSGQLSDVLLDSFGSSVGIAAYLVLGYGTRKENRNHSRYAA